MISHKLLFLGHSLYGGIEAASPQRSVLVALSARVPTRARYGSVLRSAPRGREA